jgi:hypothetical protein
MQWALCMATMIALSAAAAQAQEDDDHPVLAPAATQPSSRPAAAGKFRRSDRSFLFATEDEIIAPENGMVMRCPSHAHGSPQAAMAKLKALVAQAPSDPMTSLWVCRAGVTSSLQYFGPVVDQVVVNPFSLIEPAALDPESPVWPRCDHPVLNFIRSLRAAAGDRRLVACLNVRGEKASFRKREASFEEVEWMIAALVGANYQGIVWRSSADLKGVFDGRLARRQEELQRFAQPLGQARNLDWAQGHGKAMVSATRSGDWLFVTILNGDYMRAGKDRIVPLPLETRRTQGTVTLTLPAGVAAVKVMTLAGDPVESERRDGKAEFRYSFGGGAETYVIQTSSSPTTRPTSQSSKGE